MQDFLSKHLDVIVAAVFGWVFRALPKVIADKTMSWKLLISNIGLAAVLGFIVGSLIGYIFPHWPSEVKCSISAAAGAGCTFWMDRWLLFSAHAADRIESQVLDAIGREDTSDKKPK